MPAVKEANVAVVETLKESRPEDVALLQGLIFVVSGLWPVFHMRSFEAVSGRKTDRWLVRTVGLLLAVIGGVLLKARSEGRVTEETALLGAGASAALTAIDAVYVANGTISKVYLLDGGLQSALVALWLRAGRNRGGGQGQPEPSMGQRL